MAQFQKTGLDNEILEKIRNNATVADMSLAAEMLEGPRGLRGRKIHGLSQKDLWTSYTLPDKSLELELSFACGILNSWSSDTLDAIETIRLLSLVAVVDHEDAATAIKAAALRWGASNYICFKLAFVKANGDPKEPQSVVLDEIDAVLGHADHPALQYSALENLIPDISLFSVARRHTNSMRSKVGQNFRRSHYLNNLVSTPFSASDAAAFIHRAAETSLLDTVHGLWVLLNLKHRFPSLEETVKSVLQDELFRTLTEAQKDIGQLDVPDIVKNASDLDNRMLEKSLVLYRKSAAFLEFPRLCEYRNDIDCVVGLRLVSSLLPKITEWPSENFSSIDVLRRTDEHFDFALHNKPDVKLDNFYRTFLFLRFIQNPVELSFLDEADFKYIFNNTSDLDALLQEHELQTMHLNASDETRALVSVLALALYRGRSSDADVDFAYRDKLERLIQEDYNGSIQDFIESLIVSSPQVAHYLVLSLNDTTLQKMYRLIKSPLEASLVRRDILLSIGAALNRIEFIIEAEAIETRNQVAKLKRYFETSRMYVDSVAMKDWLEANPSAYVREYKELLPKLVSTSATIETPVGNDAGESTKISIKVYTNTAAQLVRQIASEAFKEFCTNTEFGIESYLGRRIRHNTLNGVMSDPIDGILNNPMHGPVTIKTKFGAALDEWLKFYKNYIERIRREFLQFRDSSKPNALFDPVLDQTDPSTRRNINSLSETLKVTGSDLMHDLVITFCWQQIAPQLDYASRQFKVKMAGEIKAALESATFGFRGPQEQRVLAELHEAIDSVFTTVANWFRLPETGFVPATIESLSNIIDIEFGREENPTKVTGNATDTRYYGISVHRLYDCLAVLMQNAFKHGDFHTPVSVNANFVALANTNLHRVQVSVLSSVSPNDIENCLERIKLALATTETGQDMVTEGYTGLKKLKYITKLNEGSHTVEYTNVGNEIELRFTLKVEVDSGRDDD